MQQDMLKLTEALKQTYREIKSGSSVKHKNLEELIKKLDSQVYGVDGIPPETIGLLKKFKDAACLDWYKNKVTETPHVSAEEAFNKFNEIQNFYFRIKNKELISHSVDSYILILKEHLKNGVVTCMQMRSCYECAIEWIESIEKKEREKNAIGSFKPYELKYRILSKEELEEKNKRLKKEAEEEAAEQVMECEITEAEAELLLKDEVF